MEFPHIGKNCSLKTCNKLDFLPMKCGACKGTFCSDHFAYANHKCQEANVRDVQVPVCPLCSKPVPGKRGQPPDVAVSAHIDNLCDSDPAIERRNRVFKNRCSYKGCKQRELVPLLCGECALNFCLRHRHAADHACGGRLAAKRRQAAEAAMARIRAAEARSPPVAANATITAVQGNMSEDEALARALAASLESENLHTRDDSLARALSRQRVGGEANARCSVS